MNAGNQTATVASTDLTGPFRGPLKVARGLPVNGGYDLVVPVTFTPSSAGHVTGDYVLTWTDSLGTHTVVVRVTGTGTG